MKKVCFKCGIEKELNLFYKHSRMKDGHLNKCKDCNKKDTNERHLLKKEDKDWYEKEKERHRDKYFRLGYKEKHKPTHENKKQTMKRYIEKYPEKKFSRKYLKGIKLKIKGNELHHWSYKKEHCRDVLELSILDHNLLHRNMVYDQSIFMYRDLNGILLDSKESHEQLLKSIKNK